MKAIQNIIRQNLMAQTRCFCSRHGIKNKEPFSWVFLERQKDSNHVGRPVVSAKWVYPIINCLGGVF